MLFFARIRIQITAVGTLVSVSGRSCKGLLSISSTQSDVKKHSPVCLLITFHSLQMCMQGCEFNVSILATIRKLMRPMQL